jgi:hypothetical protein
MRESELYPDVKEWLDNYLRENYKGYSIDTTDKTSRKTLENVLREKKMIVPQEVKGLPIKVDIVGILKRKQQVKFVFVEVKMEPLTLIDLGQLWVYSSLVEPIESFLISPEGFGTLGYLFNTLKRVDLLIYGKGKKMMKIAKWDTRRKTIDYTTMIPK